MTEQYYEKGGRRQWRTYCDSCKALVDDSGPGMDKLPWANRQSGICPYCGGQIYKDRSSSPGKPTDKPE
jgi:rRNA maturation endonuclease Nob1